MTEASVDGYCCKLCVGGVAASYFSVVVVVAALMWELRKPLYRLAVERARSVFQEWWWL